MPRSLHLHLVLAATLAACATARPPRVATPTVAGAGYAAYVTGRDTDAVTTPLGGVLLAGGGTDSDDGMRWLLRRGGTHSGTGYGDVVVLRTRGSDGYNSYLQGFGANSVTSLVITSVEGANSPYVESVIARADVVFIAGGDQSTYVRFWDGTAVQRAVNARIAAGYPVGGTSAGLAVLGEFVYSSLNLSSQSPVLLQNPYDSSATFARWLFTVPVLRGVLTDSHFAVRNRLGRSLTFLARLLQDGWSADPRGIAVDETSALAVLPSGEATVYGGGRGVYFLRTATPHTRVVQASTPLTLHPVSAVRVPVGGQFNLVTWSAPQTAPYTLRVDAGVVSASTGSIY